MSISASKVGLSFKCEGALALPQTDEKHDGQDEGNERHLVSESAIRAGNPPEVLTGRWPGYTWRAEVAFAYDVATGRGWEIGEGIARGYGDLGAFVIPGTADIVGRGPAGELVIVDVKSFDPSVPRAKNNPQLKTLALAASRAYGVDQADVAIDHQMRPFDVATLDVFDLEAFHDELRSVLERSAAARRRVREGLDITLTPGSHCRYCAAFHNCGAQRDLALDVRSGNADMRVVGLMPLTDDASAAQAYEFLERVKMLSKRLTSALYARAAERPIPLGDGRWFGKVTTPGNESLDADVAYDVVREKYGQEVADRAVERKATKTQIEAALKTANVKSVASAKEDVLTEIRARGGASREPSEKIKEFVHQLRAVNE